MVGIKILLYFVALSAVLLVSWQIQTVHLGWGYTLGIIGVLVAFFVAINSVTKGSRQ
jgi:hypothetical protein